MKTCAKCGVEKSYTEFYARSGAPDGYRADCKDCCKAAVRRRSAKPEVRAARHTYNTRPERKRSRRADTRSRRQEDPEGARAYDYAHYRVRLSRGSASEYRCPCGEWAHHWALDTASPWARRSALYIWGADIAAYRPRCRSCNLREDAERRERERL